MKALITGASGEIGAAIAENLAASSVTLYLHYHSNRERVQCVRQACEAKGAEVYCLEADLSKADGADLLLSQLLSPIDTLIHVAGHSLQGIFTSLTDDQMMDLMMIHLMNPMKISRALLPAMIQQKSGKIIGVSSIWGVTGASNEVAYSAAKAGLNGFIKSLAKEVALSGIQVNAVAPGAIETKMLDSYTDEELAGLRDEIPAGRLGKPIEIAQAVCYLAGLESSYVNGQILEVNGAWN